MYRILEFTIGDGTNYLVDHEWPAYALDVLPMLILVVNFIMYYPAKYLPRSYTSFSHAYKRLGNPGNKSADPRLNAVELTQPPSVSVQSAENGNWTTPQPDHRISTLSQDEWASTLPQVVDPHNREENVYRPYRPRTPSLNPEAGLLYSRA